MRRIRQSLGDQVVAVEDVARCAGAPLFRRRPGEARTGGREVLVHRPGEGAMINDQIVRARGRDGVFGEARRARLAIVARPDAQVLDDHVVGLHINAAANQRDARRRGRLPRNRDVRMVDRDCLLLEIDDTAHFEHDDPRAFFCDGFPQASRSVIVQRGDPHDLAAAAAIRDRLPVNFRKKPDRSGWQRRIGCRARACVFQGWRSGGGTAGHRQENHCGTGRQHPVKLLRHVILPQRTRDFFLEPVFEKSIDRAPFRKIMTPVSKPVQQQARQKQ